MKLQILCIKEFILRKSINIQRKLIKSKECSNFYEIQKYTNQLQLLDEILEEIKENK